ncbi:unnamed protein product, partial [Ostreobium quekettii]
KALAEPLPDGVQRRLRDMRWGDGKGGGTGGPGHLQQGEEGRQTLAVRAGNAAVELLALNVCTANFLLGTWPHFAAAQTLLVALVLIHHALSSQGKRQF